MSHVLRLTLHSTLVCCGALQIRLHWKYWLQSSVLLEWRWKDLNEIFIYSMLRSCFWTYKLLEYLVYRKLWQSVDAAYWGDPYRLWRQETMKTFHRDQARCLLISASPLTSWDQINSPWQDYRRGLVACWPKPPAAGWKLVGGPGGQAPGWTEWPAGRPDRSTLKPPAAETSAECGIRSINHRSLVLQT